MFKTIEKPISNDEALHRVFEKIQDKRKADLLSAEKDFKTMKDIYNQRMSGDYKGHGQAKWRKVASIHPLIYQAIIKQYGPNALKDKDTLKEIMSRPEMQAFLTVPLREL
jgi:Flp pilus assembly CpaE family ATPase